MRETVRSLRIYLFISGTLSTLIMVSHLLRDASLLDQAISLLGLAVSVPLLYAAVAIRRLLTEDPNRILGILYANMAYAGAMLGLSLLAFGPNAGAARVVVALLVLLYLRANVIRLSKDESTNAEPVAA